MSKSSSIGKLHFGDLHVDGAPFVRRFATAGSLSIVVGLAAIFPATAGVVLFGMVALRVLVIAAISAVLIDLVFNGRLILARQWSRRFALVAGLLFACTLPPQVSWFVVVAGTAVAVLVGGALAGGVGNYLWHPVALAHVAVQIAFPFELAPQRWPVLAAGRLLVGDLNNAKILDAPRHWGMASSAMTNDAWLVTRPIERLNAHFPAYWADQPADALATLVRDVMPPYQEMLFGVAGGAIGEAAIVAVLIAGALLLWRGVLRWQMALSAVIAALVVVAIWPVRVADIHGAMTYSWLPVMSMYEGLPVGIAYVLYHLIAGAFLFVVCLLASDPTSSPLTSRGHVLFGICLGAGTMFLRLAVGLPGSAYWVLLLLNTCVPVINRMTRRRVLGT